MIQFAIIEQAARDRMGGGQDPLEACLTCPEPPESIAMIGDDRFLSVMSRRIFRAGLTHRLVDARWPAFEVAFGDFDPDYVAALDDQDLHALTQDKSLIRHRKKIFAVRDNAIAIQAIARDYTSVGFWLAEWPEEEIVELWQELRRRFSQMGGQSSPAFLRMVGKDSFILTRWVTQALMHWGAYSGPMHTPKGHAAIQARFNDWRAECYRPLCQISQILALSIA